MRLEEILDMPRPAALRSIAQLIRYYRASAPTGGDAEALLKDAAASIEQAARIERRTQADK